MHPFKKMIFALRSEVELLPVTAFYYEGIYEYPDELHPDGGTVVFVNEFGDTVTQMGFWSGFCMEVLAQSITSHVGTVTCTP